MLKPRSSRKKGKHTMVEKIIKRNMYGNWILPDPYIFIHSRSRVVVHIRRRPEYNAICGAPPNYSLGQPSIHWAGKICPKCKKEFKDQGFILSKEKE